MAKQVQVVTVKPGTGFSQCPFCGSHQILYDAYYDESAMRCGDCGATGPIGNYDECHDKWDIRVKPDKLKVDNKAGK